ncbi:SGNH/GDSL hydrolase family protein [Paracraurococcus lichenis]|uniref:GDSL-type esterase/lipase family protein n=1 Tax=Paracraurococcus lichenis TaxID=3064888 RepID=A0ABT9DWQ7_9PROT|nr:GDSL-type esterase/lipase family protein [Paracraurococcus sp. LOR1-02]MDO9708340.1 GDSL-type esterase/lipase family protein [Paracraurococcus sp. LOR1-02]
MRRLATPLALLLGLLLPAAAGAQPCPPAPTQAVGLPATRAALARGAPLTIVAFGSSSTEGAGASDADHAYPAQLEARLHAALPGAKLAVLNRGKGGQEVHEMLARLEADVLAAHPALVVWQAGANAVLQGMPPEEFRTALAGGIARVQAAGADVLLMDSQRAPRILAAPGFERLDGTIRDLADHSAAELFSRAALMQAWAAAGTPYGEMISPDGLHHNDRGYACVAEALARSILAAAGAPQVARR